MLCACQVASVVSDSHTTPWTVAPQAPLSMGFSKQEYWSGLPFPSPGDLPDPGIELASLMSPVLAGRLFITSITWEARLCCKHSEIKDLHRRDIKVNYYKCVIELGLAVSFILPLKMPLYIKITRHSSNCGK